MRFIVVANEIYDKNSTIFYFNYYLDRKIYLLEERIKNCIEEKIH